MPTVRKWRDRFIACGIEGLYDELRPGRPRSISDEQIADLLRTSQRPRFYVHYTPTYSSWLNQVEIWFNLITHQAIRRGSFKSTKQLIAKIEQFVANDNPQAKPFA